MTANITCYALFQGLATSLDTLCAQAYGSGHKHLVGLQLQRMTFFLWLLTIPVAVMWFQAEDILALVIPERRSAELAGIYLRIILLGVPAMVAFECGKRFVQAQGLFHATTYVLLIVAPMNILMNYLFVWRFGWGYIGAPIAVVVTQNLLPLFLFLYVWLVDGSQCWGGFSKRAFTNWGESLVCRIPHFHCKLPSRLTNTSLGPMIRLALPGMIMVGAEWFAFEILTLVSGRFGTSYLAAQSVLVTITTTTFQIPFPMSIAGSTRVANLIGAKLADAAKTSAKVVSLVENLKAGDMLFISNAVSHLDFRGWPTGWSLQLDNGCRIQISNPPPLHRRLGSHRAGCTGNPRMRDHAALRRNGRRRTRSAQGNWEAGDRRLR